MTVPNTEDTPGAPRPVAAAGVPDQAAPTTLRCRTCRWTTVRVDTSGFDDQTRQRAEIIARYPRSRSALLPMLHLVQSVEGHVSQAGWRSARSSWGSPPPR